MVRTMKVIRSLTSFLSGVALALIAVALAAHINGSTDLVIYAILGSLFLTQFSVAYLEIGISHTKHMDEQSFTRFMDAMEKLDTMKDRLGLDTGEFT